MGKIKVAIVGVGNCANSLVQGLQYYDSNGEGAVQGLITQLIGPYTVKDIEIVAAFDVITTKVGDCLGSAIFAYPNDTLRFAFVPVDYGPIVQRGPTMDGLGEYILDVARVDESEVTPCHVARALKATGATVVVNYLPVGSETAARFYAQSAIEAGCAFVNCMPTFIASDKRNAGTFLQAGLPVIGDDIKSQFGATIVHRTLVQLLRDRGLKLLRTYQLNFGGNSDFLNMLERERCVSKKISKTGAVTSVIGGNIANDDVHIGPSDHVPWLGDRKIAHIRLEAEGFGGAPMSLELKLEVWDSPNSAGVVMDAIRCAQLALDRGQSGAILAPSAWYMKTPPQQMDDNLAEEALMTWIQG